MVPIQFFESQEANTVGNYNVLLSGCPAKLYDSSQTTWEESHAKFHNAFAPGQTWKYGKKWDFHQKKSGFHQKNRDFSRKK
jgi:hypothetical protein